MLGWDGLQVQIPEAMEPATLDRGFIRLFGAELPTVSLRFGPEKRRFDRKGTVVESFERQEWRRNPLRHAENRGRIILVETSIAAAVAGSMFCNAENPEALSLPFSRRLRQPPWLKGAFHLPRLDPARHLAPLVLLRHHLRDAAGLPAQQGRLSTGLVPVELLPGTFSAGL